MIFFAKTSDIFSQHSDLSSEKSSLEKKKTEKNKTHFFTSHCLFCQSDLFLQTNYLDQTYKNRSPHLTLRASVKSSSCKCADLKNVIQVC